MSSSASSPAAFVVAPAVIKSPNDKRAYRSLVLENGLRVVLVEDPDSKIAAAALAVGVGAAEDPAELPGLAHFTEHMSMQGSDKFPGDNAYKKYLSTFGGSSNASTSMEHTVYRFGVAEPEEQQRNNNPPRGSAAPGEEEAHAAFRGAHHRGVHQSVARSRNGLERDALSMF